MKLASSAYLFLQQKCSLGNLRLPRGWWLFAFGLFLFAQTQTLVHESIHPFHEHEVYCDAFDKAGQPRVDSPFFQFDLPRVEALLFRPVFYFFQPLAVSYRCYLVRAPPFSNSV